MPTAATATSGQDLHVLIPGITGSVLRDRDGHDLWALRFGALREVLRAGLASPDKLLLQGDDPDVDDLDDGITAPEVIEGITIFPGLHKCDSLGGLRNFLASARHLDTSSLLAFPYDWRRDNRVAARKLKRLVEEKLFEIHRAGAPNARAVLLAHSMGGLVARYYLEVLGGWRDCRALVTFGTPHRGSVKILEYLAHGYKPMFIRLTELVRSCTSSYQLLPIYPMLESGGTWQRVAEISGIENVNQEKARQGLAFHREIEAAHAENLKDPDYQENPYLLIPVVGTGQPTLQSARLEGGRLVTTRSVPAKFPEGLEDGDGSVPRASAIPIGVKGPALFAKEQHSSLHARPDVQQGVYDNLIMPFGPLGAIKAIAQKPGLALDLEDAYVPGEPVAISVRPLDFESAGEMKGHLQPLGEGAAPSTFSLARSGDVWTATLAPLASGPYRLEVRAKAFAGPAEAAIHDLFEVI